VIDDDVFRLTNLFPSTTGLPMTVWVGPRGAKSDMATLRVNRQDGDATRAAATAIVAIEPVPRLIKGYLSERDITRVTAWIEANQAALLAVWRGEIDGGELAERLKRVP